jgi:hypothetical protein
MLPTFLFLSSRVSAFGCECGFVKLAVVDVTKKEVVSCWSARFEGPVSTVRLFTEKSNLKPPSFLSMPQEEREEMSVHLLATNTLQSSIVYM